MGAEFRARGDPRRRDVFKKKQTKTKRAHPRATTRRARALSRNNEETNAILPTPPHSSNARARALQLQTAILHRLEELFLPLLHLIRRRLATVSRLKFIAQLTHDLIDIERWGVGCLLGGHDDSKERREDVRQRVGRARGMTSVSTAVDDAVAAVRANKLRAIGAFWLVGIGTAFAMQMRRPTRSAVSVKLIHSRIYAQAATLSALGLAAGAEMWDSAVESEARSSAEVDPHRYRGATGRREG